MVEEAEDGDEKTVKGVVTRVRCPDCAGRCALPSLCLSGDVMSMVMTYEHYKIYHSGTRLILSPTCNIHAMPMRNGNAAKSKC